MSARERLIEDRYLRDAARAMVKADIANLRADLAIRTLSERALDRVSETAGEVYEEAVEVASDHKGLLAAIVAAVIVWFARNPIRETVEEFVESQR